MIVILPDLSGSKLPRFHSPVFNAIRRAAAIYSTDCRSHPQNFVFATEGRHKDLARFSEHRECKFPFEPRQGLTTIKVIELFERWTTALPTVRFRVLTDDNDYDDDDENETYHLFLMAPGLPLGQLALLRTFHCHAERQRGSWSSEMWAASSSLRRCFTWLVRAW